MFVDKIKHRLHKFWCWLSNQHPNFGRRVNCNAVILFFMLSNMKGCKAKKTNNSCFLNLMCSLFNVPVLIAILPMPKNGMAIFCSGQKTLRPKNAMP